MKALIDLLHRKGCSCVVAKGDDVRTCWQRGVADLYDLLHEAPDFLRGARVADKVVGKGAAAVLALGKVADVWADVLSESACGLLHAAGIEVNCDEKVPFIINRTHTGRCPLETVCDVSDNPAELYPVICGFVGQMKGEG